MVKLSKYLVAIVLISAMTFFIIRASDKKVSTNYGEVIENFGYIETKLLESSRYTQSEEVPQAKLDFYHDNLMFRPNNEYLEKYNFISYPELEDEFLKVYFEKDSFSIIVYDKRADYYYSSQPTYQGLDNKLEGNVRNRQLINSGIWIDYVATVAPQQSNVITDGLYNFANVQFVPGVQNPTTPFEIVENSYNKSRVEVSVSQINNLISAEVNIKQLNFKFNVDIKLTAGVLSFNILEEGITEEIGEFTVTAITLFPYLAATRENYFPSYTIIPDGVGALVRHTEPRSNIFNGRFYGDDEGYTRKYFNNLSVPLYGIVHEVGKTGVYAHISEGAEQSILTASFYNANNNYNRISSKFYFREMHRRIIDRSGAGRDYIGEDRTESNYEINFNFLKDDASYVGVANHYQKYLLDNYSFKDINQYDDIPIHISYLMSDLEPSLLSKKRVVMTSASDVHEIYNELKSLGVNNQQITLFGYSKEGVSSGLTKMNFFGNYQPYKDLVSEVIGDGNQVYLSQNYINPVGPSSRINEVRDIAKTVSKILMKNEIIDINSTNYIRYLKPEHSYLKAKNDQRFLEKYQMGILMSSLGNNLYSTFDKVILDRNETLKYHLQMAQLNDHLLIHNPNSYLWPYLDGYLSMHVANSQYIYYTDLVPLIPIILQGIVPKFTQNLNFNALGIDRILQLVDFNIYPSYILTKEMTYKMRNTPSQDIYSTYYGDYKDEIVSTYEFLNNALKHTTNAQLISREVMELGVVKNTYNNGVVIIINYTTKDKIVDATTVKAQNYEVIL